MRLGIEEPRAFDLAGLVDQDAQRLAGAAQAVGQQGRKRGLQGMRFYSLCNSHSFVGRRKYAPKKSPADAACWVAPQCLAVRRSSGATRPHRCN